MQNQYDDEIKDGKDQGGDLGPSEDTALFTPVVLGSAFILWTLIVFLLGYFSNS